MVIMGYVEVFGTHDSPSLATLTAPLNTLAAAYNVSFFKAPISLCAHAPAGTVTAGSEALP
jgi:hypothetical protein